MGPDSLRTVNLDSLGEVPCTYCMGFSVVETCIRLFEELFRVSAWT